MPGNATWEEFEAKYDKAQEPESQLVYLVDTMLDDLIQLRGAYKKGIFCKKVGIAAVSRDGLGIVDESVHGIGCDIERDGFVWSAVAEATCIEDNDEQTNARFTINLCNAEPSLPTYVLSQVGFAAIACTHTNCFLCCAIDGCPTPHDSISIDGVINVEKLSQKNNNMQKALQEGLNWTVITKSVVAKYPELPSLIQRAKNKVGQTQRRPDMWQAFAQCNKLRAKQIKTNNGKLDWSIIEKHAKAGNRHEHATEIECFTSFLMLYPIDGLIDDLCQFARKHMPPSTKVPGQLFRVIAEMKLGPDEMIPEFAFSPC